MTRGLVAVVLVLGLAGCSAEVGDGTADQAGVPMPAEEQVVGQGRGDGENDAADMVAAADTPDLVPQHDLPSRIFELPEEDSGANLPFEDLSVFDVTARSSAGTTSTGPIKEEGLLPAFEDSFDPVETPVMSEISAPPAPRVSDGAARAGYLIQLGALPSRDSAQREWRRIENRHPDLVRDRSPTIVPVQLSSQPGTVFRLRTGPFGGLKSARSLCDQFKSQEQDCFVVKVKNPS